MKRKAENGFASVKKQKDTSGDRSAKRQRKSDATTDDSNLAKSPIAKPQNAAPKSVFKDEEKSFPRGGASILTPLEHKQIQIKATQDVLFEQAGLKRSGEGGLSDEASDVDVENTQKASKKRKSKKSKQNYAEEAGEIVRVEGLSFKVSFTEAMHNAL